MRVLLSELVSGNLKGVMKWFTESHAAGCPRCKPALTGLFDLKGRLQSLNAPTPKDDELTLTPERRAAVESAWEKADADAAGE